MAPLVDNSQIKDAQLLKPLPLYQHAYIWPFAVIWPVFLRFYLSPELYDKYIHAPEWTFVWVGTIVTFQALVWLCTHWSVNLNAAFTAKKARDIKDAQLIKVIPIANAGAAEICKLVEDKVRLLQSPLHFMALLPLSTADTSLSARSETRRTSPSSSRSADSSGTPRPKTSAPSSTTSTSNPSRSSTSSSGPGASRAPPSCSASSTTMAPTPSTSPSRPSPSSSRSTP